MFFFSSPIVTVDQPVTKQLWYYRRISSVFFNLLRASCFAAYNLYNLIRDKAHLKYIWAVLTAGTVLIELLLIMASKKLKICLTKTDCVFANTLLIMSFLQQEHCFLRFSCSNFVAFYCIRVYVSFVCTLTMQMHHHIVICNFDPRSSQLNRFGLSLKLVRQPCVRLSMFHVASSVQLLCDFHNFSPCVPCYMTFSYQQHDEQNLCLKVICKLKKKKNENVL